MGANANEPMSASCKRPSLTGTSRTPARRPQRQQRRPHRRRLSVSWSAAQLASSSPATACRTPILNSHTSSRFNCDTVPIGSSSSTTSRPLSQPTISTTPTPSILQSSTGNKQQPPAAVAPADRSGGQRLARLCWLAVFLCVAIGCDTGGLASTNGRHYHLAVLAAGGGGGGGVKRSGRPVGSGGGTSMRYDKESVELSLQTIHDIATESLGTLCVTRSFRPLSVALNTRRYDGARQKVDMAAAVLQEVGVNRHGALLDALAKSLLADEYVSSARILASNTSNGILGTSVWWVKQPGSLDGPRRVEEAGLQVGSKPSVNYPWYEDQFTSPALRSPKFVSTPEHISFRGFWTYPYFSCAQRRWFVSYSIAIPPLTRHDVRGYLSIDIDVTQLQVNQCDSRNAFAATASQSAAAAAAASAASGAARGDETSATSSSSATMQSHSSMMIIAEFQSQRNAAASSSSTSTSSTSTAASASVAGAITANGDSGLMDGPDQSPQFNRAEGVTGADAFEVEAFHGSHKCHVQSMQCEHRPPANPLVAAAGQPPPVWTRGAYQCVCRRGFYSLRHPDGFNGTTMEVAYREWRQNISAFYADAFRCVRCAPGCDRCTDASPCLATYNWPFRWSLLTISVLCAGLSLALIGYMYRRRKVKVFKVASPKFLTITLIGCAIMYSEMVAIFPILDVYSCCVTKWTRHMGFCLTYTALLMKTWRVSLTYRVKSAHKVKLTDKQLLQWMVPILLVMLIYLGTWTLSATPYAEVIEDNEGLKFKLCSYNWWDHSLAIGEVLFLAWGIRVCYNVRNAESLYNEARMISYAIYCIALVNIAMIAFHVCIFPHAGPDIKYLLGFLRTQLSTTTTIALVFGPKLHRIARGQGDQWDQRNRFRGITTFAMNGGGGLMQEDAPDPYVENEELKEEVQKLASQIEFMKIVHMEINNRHLKPKPGGYFTMVSVFQSPQNKASAERQATATAATQVATQTQTPTPPMMAAGTASVACVSGAAKCSSRAVSEDGHSGTYSLGAGSCSISYPSSTVRPAPVPTPPPPTVASCSVATTAPSTTAASSMELGDQQPESLAEVVANGGSVAADGGARP